MDELAVIGIALGSAAAGALLAGMWLSRKMRRKVAYMLDALEDMETNFRFDEHKFFFRNYHRTLNRIRDLFEREKAEVKEREHYYGNILERVRTAVVVVDLSERREGRVRYCNPAALNLLGLATFSHTRQLRTISEDLENCFTQLKGERERRCAFYNERGKITISLTAVETHLLDRPVKIVMFNDVTEEAAQSEEISWNKLIRVLTHEIMNTVTPIASLSRALSENLAEEAKGHLDTSELKMGLDTISKSSDGLIKFVNNYRTLTRISTPQKSAFFLRELMAQVRQLTSSQIENAGGTLTYVEKSEDILLYADASQIVQILVNLVKNALQAGATEIQITGEIDFAEAVVIRVSNNGRPIDEQNQEEIFVPFYTTKQEGTGIGLSISRQIMRLHNGSLDLERSDAKATVFRLTFR